jgi:SAM-dependent methyltransferase
MASHNSLLDNRKLDHAELVDAASRLCAGERLVDLAPDGHVSVHALRAQNVAAGYVFDGLERVALPELDAIVSALTGTVGRFLFLRVDRTSGALTPGRAEWERRLFAAGWSKHPLYQRLTSYEQLEHDDTFVVMALERLPLAARDQYSLASLAGERDLHMDMLRETGRRSDAHVARYNLAAQYVGESDRVLDAACGLGYGSALLHDNLPNVRIRGVDLSPSAIAYARTVFAGRREQMTFEVGDVMSSVADVDAALDVIVSFETLEHIPGPGEFVARAARALAPGGRFICSVPNQWVDETGRDPNPFHLHVFDLPRLTGLLGPHLRVDHVYAQFAGGGMKHSTAARRFVPVPPGDADDAEWWVVVATKPRTGDTCRPRPRTDEAFVERAGLLAAECRRLERECDALRADLASASRLVDVRRGRLLDRARIDPRGVVIFGAGEGGRRVAAVWRGQGGRVFAFTDNRSALWGSAVEGVPVVAPDTLPACQAALILIASSTGADDIGVQLERMGLCRDVDFTSL